MIILLSPITSLTDAGDAGLDNLSPIVFMFAKVRPMSYVV